ncbi:MAG: Rieske 2Fe-2S domain-containing protein [Deltaproteobacteria bacterium]|nr:Rieske 2Fe-2S domain-containing protein [Deltaproteobacteria bacterium]
MKEFALDLDRFPDLPFPVATVRELRKAGRMKVRAMDRQLLVVWNDGAPRLFADSCAHLGLPLSLGTLEDKAIRCRYHGWAFDTDDGQVVDQPTLHKRQPCKLKRFGALIAGGLVFGWMGDQADATQIRERLPAKVLDGFSLFRVTFRCPWPLALFSSVDYAHFPYHTGYKPAYKIYSAFRRNEHAPGTAFPSKVASEEDHRITVRIEEADRSIHMYATASEMDDDSVNFFQTFVTPVSAMETTYWECYRPRSRNPVVNLLARATFRTVTTRLLNGEDRVWTGAAAPNFVRGENIHLSENDVPLGAHLRKFVFPRMQASEGPSTSGSSKPRR